MKKQLIECVPNISEGRDLQKIHTIANVVKTIDGVKLLGLNVQSRRKAWVLLIFCVIKIGA